MDNSRFSANRARKFAGRCMCVKMRSERAFVIEIFPTLIARE